MSNEKENKIDNQNLDNQEEISLEDKYVKKGNVTYEDNNDYNKDENNENIGDLENIEDLEENNQEIVDNQEEKNEEDNIENANSESIINEPINNESIDNKSEEELTNDEFNESNESNKSIENESIENESEDTSNDSKEDDSLDGDEEELEAANDEPDQSDNNSDVNNSDNDDKEDTIKIDSEFNGFSIEALLYSNYIVTPKELSDKIMELLTLESFNHLVDIVKDSKYKNYFEVLGKFMYFIYKEKLPETNKDIVLSTLNEDEILTVYSFALINANTESNKKISNDILKDISIIPNANVSIKKIIKLIKSKHLVERYPEKKKKKKKMKKLSKALKKEVKKSHTVYPFEEAFIRYLFSIYGYYYVKKCKKVYKSLEVLLSDETKICCLLSLAKGYLRKYKFNKAKKLYLQVLELDTNNYEALIGKVLVKNKFTNINELLGKKKAKKIKEYANTKHLLLENEDNSLAYKVTELNELSKVEKKNNLIEKLKVLRKHVSVISTVLSFIFAGLKILLEANILFVLLCVTAVLMVGSSFITTTPKRGILPAIIKFIIAGGLIALTFII